MARLSGSLNERSPLALLVQTVYAWIGSSNLRKPFPIRICRALTGRAGPGGWVETGAPRDHEALVIETAGTVLLRPEICMCFTPSLVYELTCASHSTRELPDGIPLLERIPP